MSLGIAFKGPEGIVLAADSRVTLTTEMKRQGQTAVLPSTFDNARKLLRIDGQDFVGAVTYGLGALGQEQPRTAHSFIPEFERGLEVVRLSAQDFAKKLSDFFMDQYAGRMPQDYSGPDMVFLVGGYDEDAPYGRVFEIGIPSRPEPKERHAGQGEFGPVWGGQLEYANRLIHGYAPDLLSIVQKFLELSDDRKEELENHLRSALNIRIPYQFLPLQDCVDLSIFLIQTTIAIQRFIVGVRGVGGAIDVATITRTEGFKPIQQKMIVGEAKTRQV
jgi:hypothetical protein